MAFITRHTLLWQATKFAVFSLTVYRYLGNGGTDRCEIFHDGYISVLDRSSPLLGGSSPNVPPNMIFWA